jgi:hypothetical protein
LKTATPSIQFESIRHGLSKMQKAHVRFKSFCRAGK